MTKNALILQNLSHSKSSNQPIVHTIIYHTPRSCKPLPDRNYPFTEKSGLATILKAIKLSNSTKEKNPLKLSLFRGEGKNLTQRSTL